MGPRTWRGTVRRYPYLDFCRERTIYYWSAAGFQPAARFTDAHIKLVPTSWGAPTFEIDGIKMLPTARVSPYVDAEYKVGLIRPRGKRILDTCAGLGYFAAWCLRGQAAQLHSYEKSRAALSGARSAGVRDARPRYASSRGGPGTSSWR